MLQRCFGEQKGTLLCRRMSGAMVGAALGLTLAAGQAVQTPGGELPKPQPVAGHVMLPQEHQYQRQLRRFLATLTEQDFAHGVTAAMTTPPGDADREYQYRQFLYTLMNQPLVGSKRGCPSVNAPARLFLLSSIEGPNGILVPPVWPETLISFVQWNYPGNPYYNNRGLKLRAFVTASVNLMMTDNFLEQNPAAGRADWFSYQLVYQGAPYLGVRALLPADVQQAYESGLRKLAQRIIDWGPRGEEPNLDMIAPVGLWYAIQAVNDPEFTKAAEAHSRKLLADPQHFHPAGYFVERGGLDVGFSGMTHFFAVWAALAGDWPFAKEAVARSYRLRGHLCLTDPDGTVTGPTHFNTRLGSPACRDQWAWDGARDYAASLVTDEAAYLVKRPSAAELAGAAAKRATAFAEQIRENPVKERGPQGYVFFANDELQGYPWTRRMWATWDFPASVNPGYEFYRRGAYAHRLQLEHDNSPLLKPPLEREPAFIRNFENAFVVAKQAAYAAILHTGTVGSQDPQDGLFQFAGPLGFGGGQLSAFWTPQAGSVILGRRSGMTWDKSFETLAEWRTWPIHAVSGCRLDGKVFTSARIRRPEVACDIQDHGATVKVRGPLVALKTVKEPAAPDREKARDQMYDEPLEGPLDYARTFAIGPASVRIETSVKGVRRDAVAELYETLPVFIREAALQGPNVTAAIEFLAGGQWSPATAEDRDKVTAVKITRFHGAVQIAFDRPQRVKLSPAEWKDSFLSSGLCRNIMIDLREGGAAPERAIGYTITAAAK